MPEQKKRAILLLLTNKNSEQLERMTLTMKTMKEAKVKKCAYKRTEEEPSTRHRRRRVLGCIGSYLLMPKRPQKELTTLSLPQEIITKPTQPHAQRDAVSPHVTTVSKQRSFTASALVSHGPFVSRLSTHILLLEPWTRPGQQKQTPEADR